MARRTRSLADYSRLNLSYGKVSPFLNSSSKSNFADPAKASDSLTCLPEKLKNFVGFDDLYGIYGNIRLLGTFTKPKKMVIIKFLRC